MELRGHSDHFLFKSFNIILHQENAARVRQSRGKLAAGGDLPAQIVALAAHSSLLRRKLCLLSVRRLPKNGRPLPTNGVPRGSCPVEINCGYYAFASPLGPAARWCRGTPPRRRTKARPASPGASCTDLLSEDFMPDESPPKSPKQSSGSGSTANRFRRVALT